LRVVIQSPGQPCSSYNKKLSFSQKIAVAVRNQLVGKGLIYEENVRTKQLGRTAKLVIPTESGKKLLSQINEETGRTS
jgi:DNA-binding MarR family transcriptional regulator